MATVSIETRILLEARLDAAKDEDDERTLCTCFDITARVIGFLVEDDGWSDLDADTLGVMRDRLCDVMRAIFAFIAQCESRDIVDDVILIRCIRPLGIWLSEDTESFRSEVLVNAPFLVRVCKSCRESANPLPDLLRPFAHVAADAEGAQRLIENGLPDEVLRLLESSSASDELVVWDSLSVLINLAEHDQNVLRGNDKAIDILLARFKITRDDHVQLLAVLLRLLSLGPIPKSIQSDSTFWQRVVSVLSMSAAIPEDDQLLSICLRYLKPLISTCPALQKVQVPPALSDAFQSRRSI